MLAAMLGYSIPGNAEDIDIYSGLGTVGNVPNVLLVLDNAANFSSSSGGITCIIDGVATAMSGTVGGIEQCALYNVINELPVNADGSARVNIGVMVYNSNNIRDVNNANCGATSSTGGCLAQPLIAMDAAHKPGILAWIKSWNTTGGTGSGSIKASGESTAATMQEAWAYYRGRTGISGRSYASIQPAAGCQKNFVIFIGNSFNASGTPGDAPDSASPALNNAPDVTPAQKTLITNTVTTSCGTFTFPTSSHETKGFYADEWARYMNQADLYGTPTGVQNITTYSVGILGPSCQDEYAALLTNMARYGGGKYFATNDYSSLVVAILKILNEVQAVNSVFSSSSLPVSSNAQGTFLNQIYMGMFRPDAGALPRWAGNLKQYAFILDTATNTLQLGDSIGNPALDSSGTGFLSPNAISFWTCARTDNPYYTGTLTAAQQASLIANGQTCASDPVSTIDPATGGFWINYPTMLNSAGKGFDLPDGELVEKGGTGQQIRLANLSDDYSDSAGALTNPRKLYTYCPSGGACNADLTNAVNAFDTTNANITAVMFGGSSSVNISSLTRTGTTASVTTAGNHGFTTGDSISIANATPDNYNGTFTVTVTDATHFTYPITEYPPTTATGTYTASKPGIPRSVLLLTRSGTTMSAISLAHGFSAGNTVTISGANQPEYNGTFTITNVTTDTFTFTINATEKPVSPAGGGTSTSAKNPTGSCPSPCMSTVTINAWNAATPGVVRAPGQTTVTVTTGSNHAYGTGRPVTLTGVVDSTGTSIPEYNGTFTITSIPSPKSFTFTTAISPATPATGIITASIPTVTKNITSLTRTGSTATATVAAHGFSNNDTIVISGTLGTNESAYVGSFTISNATANTFDYPVTVTPATPATGVGGSTMTATRGGATPNRTSLIHWIRGEDNYGDETGPGGTVNIRPSVHGDVLHSRPTVLNYGGSTGVIVFYGDNGGVYHAVNGNQTNPSGSTLPAPGSELWGFIPSEMFPKFNRLRTNSPQLNLPSTPPGILPAPSKKDYFVDGFTGVYQLVDSNGTTLRAVLFLSMRRGGRLLYALDVTNPTVPILLWKKDNTSTDMGELGQTWSQPKVARVAGYANPVLIFGAGYDTNEDVDPPTVADTMGRGIFVLDALTGSMVWNATPQTVGGTSCAGTVTQAACLVEGMNYSIPADITLMDKNADGFIDRLYAADTGGNIWRVDLEPAGLSTPDHWRVNRLAALGCGSGPCSIPTSPAPRKFFFPPEVISTTTYDAVIAGTGDREHPLYVDVDSQKSNRVFFLKDMFTGNDATGMTPITADILFDATSATYNGSANGYKITLGNGEKVVNAPLVTAGFVFFGTNQPTAPSANSCTSSLGIAKGYRLQPLTGQLTHVVFAGGGLPPSPVSGVVEIRRPDGTTIRVPFLIGGGNPECVGSDCLSALGGQKPPISVSTSRIRTYWYLNNK
jgi:type IV pilus assembly protein PilY1